VIEQAIETAALMLGSDRSRGYCLEMICADFLAGANLDNPDLLLHSISRCFGLLPAEQQQKLGQVSVSRDPASWHRMSGSRERTSMDGEGVEPK
jgi:hypothetical protein